MGRRSTPEGWGQSQASAPGNLLINSAIVSFLITDPELSRHFASGFALVASGF